MSRRDWTERTPPFRLTDANRARLDEVEAMCVRFHMDPTASIALELEHMQRNHCYAHRPIIGICGSLTVAGDQAFEADWEAHREQHMAEAFAAYDAMEQELATASEASVPPMGRQAA